MATPRKTPLTFDIVGSGPELAEAITQIATTPGTHSIKLTLNGATMKAVTDRMRRIPRQRGLNALTVKADVSDDGAAALLVITNTGKKATPWPKRPAPAKKAPAKSTAKVTDPAKGRARSRRSIQEVAGQPVVATGTKAPAKRSTAKAAK